MENLSPVGWAIRPLRKYADFSGRAPRAEYWWYVLAVSVAGFVIGLVDKAISPPVVGLYGPLSFVWTLGLIVPGLAVVVRRLHDIGKSGWWVLVKAGGYVFVIISFASPRPAAMFPMVPRVVLIVGGLAVVLGAIILFFFMITEGDGGPNRYGPDPYGHGSLEEVFA